MSSDESAGSDRTEAVIEEILDHVLQGETCDVELILARHGDLSHAQRELVRAMGADLLARGGKQVAPANDRPTATPATTFGHYLLLQELGRGGQGVVYLAQDTRLPRKVALKILSRSESALTSEKSASASEARLMREAEVAAKLDHPGICVVHEVGREDGRPFIAMRFVEGRTLASKIVEARADGRALRIAPQSSAAVGHGEASSASEQRRAVMSCVQLVESAARAMHVAHQAHVIHRDVKPANIMVTPAGEPVILDFGLARDEDSDAATLTLSGEVFGSPAYMSPEQIEARHGAIDARTDVYALGVVLYECLTLRRPFEAPTRDGLYRAILNETALDVRTVRPALARDLAIVIATALEKDLGRRYKSALDFAEDLRRVREHEPILARPAGPLLRLRRWTQRNPRLATAVLGAFVTLLAIIVMLDRTLAREKAQSLLSQSTDFCSVDPARALRCAEQAAKLGTTDAIERDRILRNALAGLREMNCVRAHERQIDAAQLSDDGRWMATCGQDGFVRLWDARTWQKRREVGGFHSPPRIALSADGRWLAAESDEDAVRVWDTETWSEHALDMPAHHGSLAFAPDSTRIAFVRNDGRNLDILSVDPSARDETRHLDAGPLGDISTITWSPDSRWLCTFCEKGYRLLSTVEPPIEQPLSQTPSHWLLDFSRDGTLVLLPAEHGIICFDLRTRRVLETYPPAGPDAAREVQLARLDPGAKRVLVAYADGGAAVFERGGAACPLRLQVGSASIGDACFSRDGSKILMMRGALSPVVCDAYTGDQLAELATTQADAAGTALWDETHSESPCVTFHTSGAMRRWRLESGWEHATFRGLGLGVGVAGIAFDAAGERVVAASRRSVQVLDWRTRKSGPEFGVHKGTANAVVFHPDGRSIATGSQDGYVCIWDVATAAQLRKWTLADQVWDIDISPDGRWLISACTDHLVHVFDIVAGTEVAPFREHGGGVRSVRFDTRGERVVSVSESDGHVRVWDFAGRRQVESWYVSKYTGAAPEHAPLNACIAPDGRHVAITSYDGLVTIWDMQSRTVDRRKLCARPTHGVDYSPDGKWLAVAGDDRNVHLLQVGGAREDTPLAGHRGGVQTVRFSRDSQSLVSQDIYGDVHVWRMDLLDAASEALLEIESIPLRAQ